MKRIEVTVSHSDFSQSSYIFWFNERDTTLVLDTILHSERATKRHKFTPKKYWSRLNARDSNISREEPPAQVKQQAKEIFVSWIKFES